MTALMLWCIAPGEGHPVDCRLGSIAFERTGYVVDLAHPRAKIVARVLPGSSPDPMFGWIPDDLAGWAYFQGERPPRLVWSSSDPRVVEVDDPPYPRCPRAERDGADPAADGVDGSPAARCGPPLRRRVLCGPSRSGASRAVADEARNRRIGLPRRRAPRGEHCTACSRLLPLTGEEDAQDAHAGSQKTQRSPRWAAPSGEKTCWWAIQGSNLGPHAYQACALTS